MKIILFLGTFGLILKLTASTKLITIMVDALRWDYFDKYGPGDLPGFERMERDGVKASHLVSQFPANSYNNYYSLMTGILVFLKLEIY